MKRLMAGSYLAKAKQNAAKYDGTLLYCGSRNWCLIIVSVVIRNCH